MEKNTAAFKFWKSCGIFSLLVLSEKFNPANESMFSFVL